MSLGPPATDKGYSTELRLQLLASSGAGYIHMLIMPSKTDRQRQMDGWMDGQTDRLSRADIPNTGMGPRSDLALSCVTTLIVT